MLGTIPSFNLHTPCSSRIRFAVREVNGQFMGEKEDRWNKHRKHPKQKQNDLFDNHVFEMRRDL